MTTTLSLCVGALALLCYMLNRAVLRLDARVTELEKMLGIEEE